MGGDWGQNMGTMFCSIYICYTEMPEMEQL
jgi:hypothetical protein